MTPSSSSSDADLPSGTRIGPYAVGAVLGKGAYGVVVSATHDAREGRFALKVIHERRKKFLPRLRRERELQWQVRHPNVVRVIEQIQFGPRPVLVLELIEGPNLLGFLREQPGPLPFATVDVLAMGIIAGVGAAHREDIIHRDLKPENILVGPGLVPKVSDFGLSKALGRPPGQSLTMPMGMLGTPSYMAPEQAVDAKTVDHRADLFSLGCILYELVTGHQAFPGSGMFSVLERIDRGEYVPIARLRPDCPARMVAAIEACLVTDPDRRMPDCATLLRVWSGEATWSPRAAVAYDEGITDRVRRIGPPGRSFDSGSSAEVYEPSSDRTAITIVVPQPELAQRTRRGLPARPAEGSRTAPRRRVSMGQILAGAAAVALPPLVAALLVVALYAAVAFVRGWPSPPAPQPAPDGAAVAAEAAADLPVAPVAGRSADLEGGMAPPAPAPPETVAVTIRSAPSGATASLDGVVIGPTPLDATLTVGKTTRLELRSNGYEPRTLEVTGSVGMEPVEVALKPTRPPPEPPAPPPAEPTPPRLNVRMVCGGWAHVYVDGEKLGHPAPLNVEVAPGLHEVRVENPATGLREVHTQRFDVGRTVPIQVCAR